MSSVSSPVRTAFCLPLLALLALGCDDGAVIDIDARRDVGVGDLGLLDGAVDAGGDTGVLPDGGCAPEPDPYAPLDTGGPAAESQASCELRVGPSEPALGPMGQRFVVQTLGSVASPVAQRSATGWKAPRQRTIAIPILS